MGASRELAELASSYTSGGLSNMRNRIINGAMGIWQRGTSFTNPTTTNFYTADRWGVNRAGDATGATVSRSTDVPSGFQYSLRLQRTAGNTSTAGLYLFNSNESVNTLDLAGQQVTISFWAKAGANYSGGSLTVTGQSGTATDQRVYAYTGAASFISTSQAITSTWTLYSFTGTVAANATEVGMFIYYDPTGTAGADDSVYITGVQLEKGSTATSFDYRPYGTELQLCQRYCVNYRSADSGGAFFRYGVGQCDTTTNVDIVVQYPVPMRITPTVTTTGTAANYGVYSGGITTACSSVPSVNASSSYLNVAINAQVASGLTVGRACALLSNNSNTSYLLFSAEL